MKQYSLSMRCYYGNGAQTTRHQTLALKEIPKWIEAYQFTHPSCESITVKVWLRDEERSDT